jgi:hypothetical protein
MKRLAVVICLAVLFLSIAVWAANQQTPFNGTWQLNIMLSEASPKFSSDGMGGMGGGFGGMGGGMGGMGGGMGGMGGGMGGMGGGRGGVSGGRGGGGGQAAKQELTVKRVRIAGIAVAAGVDGTWEGETMVMNQPTKMTFTFKADEKKLAGTAPGPNGPVNIEDGKIDGNNLSFNFNIDFQGTKMAFKYNGVLSGDEIKLTYESETGGGGMGARGGGMGMPGGGMGGRGGGMGTPGGGLSGMGQGGSQMAKTLVIEQTATEMKITSKAVNNGQDLVETFQLDGKEKGEIQNLPNKSQAKQLTKVKLDKSKLTINVKTGSEAGNQNTKKREFVLSNSGKVLTLKITMGGRVNSTQKLVYDKE